MESNITESLTATLSQNYTCCKVEVCYPSCLRLAGDEINPRVVYFRELLLNGIDRFLHSRHPSN